MEEGLWQQEWCCLWGLAKEKGDKYVEDSGQWHVYFSMHGFHPCSCPRGTFTQGSVTFLKNGGRQILYFLFYEAFFGLENIERPHR